MLSITLKPQEEYQWIGENPAPNTFLEKEGWHALYHQWLTYNAEEPIIVNTYNTGTGKTKAALLRLLKRARKIGADHIVPSRDNALLIAPTNELLAQHVRDAKKFCEENSNDLPYRVLAITKEDLEEYRTRRDFSEERLRRGAVLQAILQDASKADNDVTKGATLYVVNPDIFYYALYYCYGPYDRKALFSEFLKGFNYIIIDEFHYFNPKQFATFLFFIKLSLHRGYINSTKQRQFCILTATPRPQVATYLNNLGVPIKWITPGTVDPDDLPYVQPIRALAPVQMQVYNVEDLSNGGLLQLATQQQFTIQKWLNDDQDGAIISSSLGTISRIHHELSSTISPTKTMGRITGPEKREVRRQAQYKQLILATPTVDIGYNFERATRKSRQNIDFLLFDAYTGDEFVQRLGRAARVLGKEQADCYSTALAVVDPTIYSQLKIYDGQEIERVVLSQLAGDPEKMPARNDLYVYIKTQAIVEALRPIAFIGQATSHPDLPDLETFFRDLQILFADKITYTYSEARQKLKGFEHLEQFYGELQSIPAETFDILPPLIENRLAKDAPITSEMKTCIETFQRRIKDAYERHEGIGRNGREILAWLRSDLRTYVIERARFNFRESFQPPLALVHDPKGLLSSNEDIQHDALHIARYYDVDYLTANEWHQQRGNTIPQNIQKNDVVLYGTLKALRDEPLQIGLQLQAGHYSQAEWEDNYAYQITALYGLEIVARKDHHGLPHQLSNALQTRYIPAFVVRASSATASKIRAMQKQARFFPQYLDITFNDGMLVSYFTILGSMAFQICAEIPPFTIRLDRFKSQRADDSPLIC